MRRIFLFLFFAALLVGANCPNAPSGDDNGKPSDDGTKPQPANPQWVANYQNFLVDKNDILTDPAADAKYLGLTTINKPVANNLRVLKDVDLPAIGKEFDAKFTATDPGALKEVYTYNNPTYPDQWILILYPTHDWNKAFIVNNELKFRLLAMSVFHSVKFMRVGDVAQISQELEKYKAASVRYLVIGGHGRGATVSQTAGFLELGDGPIGRLTPDSDLTPEAKTALHPRLNVFFDSCSVGSGTTLEISVPRSFSKKLGRPVMAATISVSKSDIFITSLYPFGETVFSDNLSGSKDMEGMRHFIQANTFLGFLDKGKNIVDPDVRVIVRMMMADGVNPSQVDNRILTALGMEWILGFESGLNYNFSDGSGGTIAVTDTKMLSRAANLRWLEVLDQPVTNLAFENLPNLTKVWVRNAPTLNSQLVLDFITQTKSKTNITSLFLDSPPALGDTIALSAATNMPQMSETLFDQKNGMTDVGFNALAALPNMKALVSSKNVTEEAKQAARAKGITVY